MEILSAVQAAMVGLALFIFWCSLFDYLYIVAARFSRRVRITYFIYGVSCRRMTRIVYRYLVPLMVVTILVMHVLGFDWGWVSRPLAETHKPAADVFAIYYMLAWLIGNVASESGFRSLLIGIPPRDRARLEATSLAYTVIIIVLTGLVAHWFPGPYASVGMLAVLIEVVVVHRRLIGRIAMVRRNYAPQARDDVVRWSGKTPILLFISDTHLTDSGDRQASGEASGNRNLGILAQRLSIIPRWIVVLGDVTDRGRTTEWQEAAAMLSMLRKRGTRILLAPGNHDLSGAYELNAFRLLVEGWWDHLYTTRIAYYLANAFTFEPELKTHDGRKLRNVFVAETQPVIELGLRWQQACQFAASELKAIPLLGVSTWLLAKSPLALRWLKWYKPARAAELLDPLVDEAISFFKSSELPAAAISKEAIVHLLTRSWRCDFHPNYTPEWKSFWFDIFPLKIVDSQQGIEFLIVNSNVTEHGLLGSARGRLGKSQMGRLVRCVAESTQPIIVILMHHPICRWSDDTDPSANIDRWAFLAHDTDEATVLLKLLSGAAPASCRQIFLCGGHVHDTSRVGQVISDPIQDDKRIWVVESPALPDLGTIDNGTTDDLVLCERGAGRSLRPVRVRWADLVKVAGKSQKT